LAFLFFIRAVNLFGVSKASAYTNLIPIVTVIGAAVLIKEPITYQVVIGMLIVLSGVSLSQLKGNGKV
jgi:drug/metabolite transporter (DMT)-like permease